MPSSYSLYSAILQVKTSHESLPSYVNAHVGIKTNTRNSTTTFSDLRKFCYPHI